MFAAMIAVVLFAQSPPAAENPAPPADAEKAKLYVDKGMPAPDQPWSAKEYADAARLLISLKEDGSLPLPRLRDDPSGGVFAKLVDPATLKVAEDEKIPVPQRVGEALNILNAANRTMTTYLVGIEGRQPYGAELLELVLFELRVIDRLSALVDAFTAALTPEQRAEPIRQEGLKQMKGGFIQVAVGTLSMIGETKRYGEADLRSFAGRFPDRLAPLWPLLPPPTQAECRLKIQDLAKTHADAEVRKSMDRLIEKLDAGAKAPSGR